MASQPFVRAQFSRRPASCSGRFGGRIRKLPGCVDFIVFGARSEVPEKFRGRPSYYHNPEFTLVRLTREEQVEVARSLAKKLNEAKGRVELLVPTRGLSIPNHEKGGEFWAPEFDAAFREELKAGISKEIAYREVDAHINDEEFAREVLEAAQSMFLA